MLNCEMVKLVIWAVGLTTTGDSIGMRSWKFNPGDPELPMIFNGVTSLPSHQ